MPARKTSELHYNFDQIKAFRRKQQGGVDLAKIK